jgi:CRISPR-associated protein Csx10
MKTILFHITPVQPLLLTSLQGDPNSSVSFPFIPGSVIRGALIGRYIQREGNNLSLEDEQVQRWFFDGTTRYLHGYPLINGRRSIPLPRSLVAEKLAEWEHDRLPVYDRSDVPPAIEALRSLTGFLSRDQRGTLWHTATRMVVNIHNQRDRPRGRGVEGQGAVFRYEAIAPEQTFVAAILCNDADAATIKGWMPEKLWLGGSRSAGYGEVNIDNIQIVDDWPEILAIAHAEEDDEEADGELVNDSPLRLTLTLTSDMLVRAPSGGYTTEPPHTRLSALLGMNLTFDKTRTTLGTTLLGGFNRTWGLPIPQTPALAAGSVLSYICSTPPNAANLATLEMEGLGERRAEGFGRVICNLLPSQTSYELRNWHSEQALSVPDFRAQVGALDQESRELAEVMARRILEQRLEARLIKQTEAHQISGTISNTQLSRLRIIARRSLGSGDLHRIEQFLTNLPSNAREQFARARVGHRSFDTWLKEHLSPVAAEWDDQSLKLSVAGIELEPTESMKRDFTLRLLMAMARLKVKSGEDE